MKKGNQKMKGATMMMALCLMVSGSSFADVKATNTWDKAVLSKNVGYAIEKKATGDVTGDGKNDTVYVLGHKFDKTGQFRDHYRIAVLNGSTHTWIQTALPSTIDGGYDAALTLADLQGNKANEILLVSPTGGSGGYVNFVAYRVEGNSLKTVLDSDQGSKTTEITGSYQDDYQVNLTLKQLSKQFTLNVKDRKPFYEEGKIYAADKLVVPAKPDAVPAPWGGGVDQVTLKKNPQTGRNDLVWHTVAKGIANVDSLAEIMVTWTANGTTLKPSNVQLKQMYAVDADLLSNPSTDIKSLVTQKGDVKTALTLAAPATKALIKNLYAVTAQPAFYPTELQRQESDPQFTLTVTYKNGKSETLKTTETGEFIYRSLDANGSWTGGKSLGLAAQVELAKKMSATPNLGKNIVGINAEPKANSQLEKVIISKLGIPKEEFSRTRYYYNYVDLNNDGRDEIFVVVSGPYTSGTGGSTAMIVVPTTTSGYQVNQTFTLINTPVIISDKMSYGCHEIITRRSGGGAIPNYVALTCRDGHYSTVNQGVIVKSLNNVSGTAIICDDMIKHAEQGTGLFLTGK